MKKSKFLKKSLATLLALMLVVAMIPMSAAAAGEYKPASVKPVIHTGSGEVTGSGQSWNIAFDYSATAPVIDVELGTASDKVYVIELAGTEVELIPGTGKAVEYDTDGKPVPFKFVVTSDNTKAERSAVYTVNWTMAEASSSVTVKSAKLDTDYAGEVDETAKTITFTVPFGYDANKAVALEFNGANATTKTHSGNFSGTVGTARAKATAEKVSVVSEDGLHDYDYLVYVVEEPALESISIGGVEGVFGKNADGLETGTITFNMPSDTALKDGKLMLTPSFAVGSNYKSVTLDSKNIASGEEFDFASILNAGEKDLVLTSVAGDEVTYKVTMQNVLTDTTITGFTATPKDGVTVEGVVDGDNLTVVVPSDADLSQVVLEISGPKAVGSNKPTISSNPASDFDADGTVTVTVNNYTAPVRFKITAADGTTQKYYTLTITKTEDVDNNPQITAAKLTTNKGLDNEANYTGDVSQSAKTITFTIPYSTTDEIVKEAGTTEYTFGKTNFATLNKTELSTSVTVKDGAKVSVTSATGDTVTYTVKFVKSGAQSGKTISDFVLTTEGTNSNLIPYNNNKNYNVAVSGKEFKVTVPNVSTDLYANFKLSDGAKLYSVNGETVSSVAPNFDGTTGAFKGAAFTYTDGTKYFVADETLAYAIATGDTKAATYTQIKNNYSSHLNEYTFKTTVQANDKARLTSLSADDGLVTATINGNNEITLTVPYGYATKNTVFFFDFKVSDGAVFGVDSNAAGTVYPFISGGLVDYVNEKIVPVDAKWSTNPGVRVVETATGSGKYKLQFGIYDSTDWFDFSTDGINGHLLTVEPEDSTKDSSVYTIKEVKVADANTGADITSLKVNNSNATISGKTINVTLPYGTNLGQVKLAITASKLADVKIWNGTAYVPFNADNNYVLTSNLKIEVKSEDGKTTNIYTLKATVAAKFVDVPENAWYYDYVMAAAKAGIVNGKENSRFDPEGDVTRRDFALMLTRMLGVDVSGYTNTPFNDVKAGDYGLGAIAYCAENGIVGGDGKGNFLPDSSITREEAAKMIAVAKELKGTTTEKFKDDAQISSWAKVYVDACKAAGIFGGDEKGNFNPKSPITRAETAKIMVVAMNLK